MAAKKPIENETELDEPVRELTFNDDLTIVEEQKEETYKGPTVRIYLPKLEDPGDAGLRVDQFEHVTISNQFSEKRWYIKRGEWVEVPVPVFMVLKEKYPDI